MAKSRKIHPANGLHLSLFEPTSDWTPPEYYPDLSDAKLIAIDTETKDPNLRAMGPGGIRKDGKLVGIAIATDTGFSGYYPIAHFGGGNLDHDTTLRWLQTVVSNPNQIKIGANFIYDLEWLHTEGIKVKGPIHDIQIMEGLLDEEGKYSLNALARKYLGGAKQEKLLREAASAFGCDPKKDLWRLHSKFVGPYGEGDAVQTLRVYKKQLPLIEKEGLSEVFKLESDLTPVLFEMRKLGVRVDIDKANQLENELRDEYESGIRRIAKVVGKHTVNIWAADDLLGICRQLGIQHETTSKGNPSFRKEWLEQHEHPSIQKISELRTLDRLCGTFIREKIINCSINGRVHAQFHQMKNDEDGTRTGRLSSSNPNQQQVPSRSKYASRIRGLFIPEEGMKWAKLDYSQQEPRIAVHYACVCNLAGSEAARNAYLNGVDFYDFITKMAGITRRQAKDLTLGRMYGMGGQRMAEKIGCLQDEANRILNLFDTSVPFIKKLSELTENRARKTGVIKTIGGRHRHFDLWVPAGDRVATPYKLGDAEAIYHGKRLERWGCRKALNSLIQGSAADMTKRAMVEIYNQFGKIPHMQVHDEVDYSVVDFEEAKRLNHVCETAVQLMVPVVCDIDYGDSWK